MQAFRYGEHAYGFQFHLEVSRSLIERWLTVPDHQEILMDDRAGIDAAAIRARTAAAIGPLEALSRETFGRWINRFEIGPKRRHLPSR